MEQTPHPLDGNFVFVRAIVLAIELGLGFVLVFEFALAFVMGLVIAAKPAQA